MIEDRVVREARAEERDLRRAQILVDMFKDVFETVDERTNMEHDISYMDGHIEVIKSYL
jgi:malonyl CoA-acyl carrier protein transacylase